MAYFRRRGCTCWKSKCKCDAEKKSECTCGASEIKIKKCTCGAKWSFSLDAGVNPKNGKRKQKTVSGFNTRDEAEKAATILEYELLSKTFIADIQHP
jgi:hypothetical protein